MHTGYNNFNLWTGVNDSVLTVKVSADFKHMIKIIGPGFNRTVMGSGNKTLLVARIGRRTYSVHGHHQSLGNPWSPSQATWVSDGYGYFHDLQGMGKFPHPDYPNATVEIT